MARNKQRKAKARKAKRRNQSTAPIPRKRRDEAAAVRGMLVGGGILCLIAFLAFVRVGGDTPLNHFFSLFGSDDAVESSDKAAGKSGAKKAQRSNTLSTQKQKVKRILKSKTSRSNKTQIKFSPKPSISKNAGKAPPLEKLTDGDKAGLDKLIKVKGK